MAAKAVGVEPAPAHRLDAREQCAVAAGLDDGRRARDSSARLSYSRDLAHLGALTSSTGLESERSQPSGTWSRRRGTFVRVAQRREGKPHLGFEADRRSPSTHRAAGSSSIRRASPRPTLATV